MVEKKQKGMFDKEYEKHVQDCEKTIDLDLCADP